MLILILILISWFLTIYITGVSHSPASLHCLVELDNSRLQTQGVARTSCPVWNKEFRLAVRDIHSCLQVSLLDRDRSMKTQLLGRLCLPLLKLANCGNNTRRTFVLKDKHLRQQAKGNSPSLELEWSLDWDLVTAALVTVLSPRQEILMNKTEKFKRKKFSDNLARVKSLYSQAEQVVLTAGRSIHWERRSWVLQAWIIFLLVTATLQLYMLPLLLAAVLAINFVRLKHREAVAGVDCDKVRDVREWPEDYEEREDKEKEEKEDVSLNKIMQMVQDAFPLIQNCLGLVASSAEKLRNTFNFSVPFLSLIALVSLLLISLVLALFDLRTIILVVGSVKFLKNLVVPGWESNNELVDFLSRVPDDRMLEETRELGRRPE